MGMHIPVGGSLDAFAMIVDINGFAPMVDKSEGNSIAQFVRDVLTGGIEAVERNGGEVVGFMGDAFLAILPSAEEVARSCFGIAKDLDRQCEYISIIQHSSPDSFWFAPGGPSLKIGIEYGFMDVSSIQSNFLGEHKLLIGSAINHASRIMQALDGNRCLVGPNAAKQGLDNYALEGPMFVPGKNEEAPYEAYEFDLGDIWRAGVSNETYWG